MTAEIAIMNQQAVALAADSAVTMGEPGGEKISYSANKLFSLSKYHPVGIMVYGNAYFMGIPWETIIKVYRRKLGRTKYDTLEGYAESFIDYLNKENALFPESEQVKYFRRSVENYFHFNLKENIDDEVKSALKDHGKLSEKEVEQIIVDL